MTVRPYSGIMILTRLLVLLKGHGLMKRKSAVMQKLDLVKRNLHRQNLEILKTELSEIFLLVMS